LTLHVFFHRDFCIYITIDRSKLTAVVWLICTGKGVLSLFDSSRNRPRSSLCLQLSCTLQYTDVPQKTFSQTVRSGNDCLHSKHEYIISDVVSFQVESYRVCVNVRLTLPSLESQYVEVGARSTCCDNDKPCLRLCTLE